MKYDIFNPKTGKVLGWAQTLDAAERRAQFFFHSSPVLQIRLSSTKRVVKEVREDVKNP